MRSSFKKGFFFFLSEIFLKYVFIYLFFRPKSCSVFIKVFKCCLNIHGIFRDQKNLAVMMWFRCDLYKIRIGNPHTFFRRSVFVVELLT